MKASKEKQKETETTGKENVERMFYQELIREGLLEHGSKPFAVQGSASSAKVKAAGSDCEQSGSLQESVEKLKTVVLGVLTFAALKNRSRS